MKYILFIIGLLCFNLNYAQNNAKFYVEIINKQGIPIPESKGGGIVFENDDLTNLFKKNEVVKFELAFPGAIRELLKRTYILECSEDFVTVLNSEYSNYYKGIVKVPEITPLFMPNDFGLSGAQPELSFINAQQAWDITTGNSKILLGVNDTNVNTSQQDLVGKTFSVDASAISGTSSSHGTLVSSICAAQSNNGIGMASIGYNCSVRSSALGYSGLMPLVTSGVRVINMSWGGCQTNPITYEDELLKSIWEDFGVVLVAAAGNGSWSCPSGPQYDHFPASYNNVISVTNVGHHYDIGTSGVDENLWKDVFLRTNPPFYATYNTNVDLSAPGRGVLGVSMSNATVYAYDGGTSISAPMVTGTIGLMFSVNPCLFPDEVESILKLTAVKNDLLPQNILYQGKIGAGRLEAYKAVDMARDMADALGTVEIDNRIIDRWKFILKTNPYKIKMSNNILTNSAVLDFSARNSIDVISGDYKATMDLKINTSNTACNTPVSNSSRMQNISEEGKASKNTCNLYPNPNNGNFMLNFGENKGKLSIKIVDIFGKVVYTSESNEQTLEVMLPNISSGVYIVKINGNAVNETIKFIKK
ncbi:S8 family peptidase [Flavobacterium sp. SM15]|uniref:S8 family peptidase n=1 Tax=Flavobacterium sp. SM15 TaxID=2908005 RepID=UPI001EDB2D31|nr:S8 family peptidase [Flavobacterium sp. SM15]MCG2611006.1 S8 family peptidase [Flavobacterium sp. SM15]